ncbi:MAG: hypothetical protein RLZZ59_915 [Pseudomonadota bacterium]|jgi:hypothetical protein
MTRSHIVEITQNLSRTLWLSVTSGAFYRDLYHLYKGYGLKYMLMVISITSIIYTIVSTNRILDLKSYLEDTSENSSNPIEYMLKQWPEMYYDGKSLTRESSEPIFISAINGTKLIAIDTEETLAKNKLSEFPIVLLKNKLMIFLVKKSNGDNQQSSTEFSYEGIFDKTEKNIDSKYIRELLLSWIQPVTPAFILLLLPIIIAARLGIHIFRNFFNAVILYGLLWWRGLSPNIPSVTRIILFASCPAEIIYAIILVTYPPLAPIAMMIDSWTIILAAYNIIIRKK